MADYIKETMTENKTGAHKARNAWDAGPPTASITMEPIIKADYTNGTTPRQTSIQLLAQPTNYVNGIQNNGNRHVSTSYYNKPMQPRYVAGRNQTRFNDFYPKPFISNDNTMKRHTIYYSAGVLPYSRDAGGNIVFLLGKDKEGNWSDFGGRSEHQDGNNQVKTAARELYEETMGSVMPIDAAIRMLSHSVHESSRTLISSKTLGGSPYYMYSLEIVYTDYRKNFKRVHDYVKYIQHKYIEKNDIRWVTRETLISAATSAENSQVLIPLRPIFRTTLANHIDEIRAIGVIGAEARAEPPSDSGDSQA